MAGPLIAVVGSASPGRAYDPPVDTDTAHAIARQLGAELGRTGCRIVVYHSGADFIEGTVVSGFVEANPPTDKAIIVRQPQGASAPSFPEQATHPKLFDPRGDTSDDWEVSFYRSLADAEGVVLIGGGQSTVIAGQVAVGSRIPILAVAASGGGALKVWKTLSPGLDLPTRDEHTLMGQPWTDGSAAACVKTLLDQRRRRYAVESASTLRHAALAAGLFMASIVIALLSASIGRQIWLLYSSTLLGGGAGAAIRTVFERRYGAGPLVTPSLLVTLALGMIAGGLAGMLYVGAQPGSIKLSGDDAFRVVSFVVIVSVIGGLTADAVYRKLLGLDVIHSRLLVAQDASAGNHP